MEILAELAVPSKGLAPLHRRRRELKVLLKGCEGVLCIRNIPRFEGLSERL